MKYEGTAVDLGGGDLIGRLFECLIVLTKQSEVIKDLLKEDGRVSSTDDVERIDVITSKDKASEKDLYPEDSRRNAKIRIGAAVNTQGKGMVITLMTEPNIQETDAYLPSITSDAASDRGEGHAPIHPSEGRAPIAVLRMKRATREIKEFGDFNRMRAGSLLFGQQRSLHLNGESNGTPGEHKCWKH